MTGMARAEARGGLGGDFATGAFAALMAMPCSAPFVGTAVAFALTRGPVETVAVFGAMGLGLASALPRRRRAAGAGGAAAAAGAWMAWIKGALGLLLVGTAIWLVMVLAGSAGWRVAGIVGGLWRRCSRRSRRGGVRRRSARRGRARASAASSRPRPRRRSGRRRAGRGRAGRIADEVAAGGWCSWT